MWETGGLEAAALPMAEKFANISHNRAEIDHKFMQNFRKQWKFYQAVLLPVSPSPTPMSETMAS